MATHVLSGLDSEMEALHNLILERHNVRVCANRHVAIHLRGKEGDTRGGGYRVAG